MAMNTQNALEIIIFSCIVSMTFLGGMSFVLKSNSPELIMKIVESMGVIVSGAVAAKAGLTIPSLENNRSTDTSGKNPDPVAPEKKQ
jgi:hypothetical protein